MDVQRLVVMIGARVLNAVKSFGDRRMSWLVESVNAGSNLAIVKAKVVHRVLLLQGPAGPFFNELQEALSRSGYATRRVAFNAGDKLFAPVQNCEYFTGTMSEWETWLRFELALNKPDTILLFGSSRPVHKIARHLADIYGIDVLSLEEGYLRSGYINCEIGGNNQHSPLAHWRPKSKEQRRQFHAKAPYIERGSSHVAKGIWAAVYYLVRDFASKPSDTLLFHRERERVVSLSLSWSVHCLRRLTARITEFPTRRALRRSRGYVLIPLQVSTDSQILSAARGWSTSRLIEASLIALRANPHGQRVVFKLHPLERDSAKLKRLILRRVDELGVDLRRIAVLHSGHIGELTKRSGGMIVINSTSAFSALHHNIPLLVLGDAVFRHDAIATLGETEADIAAFLKIRHTKSRLLVDAFIDELKSLSLIPGDFYVSRGRRIAIAGILGKLTQRNTRHTSKKRLVDE